MSSIALAFDFMELILAASRFPTKIGLLPPGTMRLPVGCTRRVQCASAQQRLVLFGLATASHLLATAPSSLTVHPVTEARWAERIRDRVLRGRLRKVKVC
jgi:hypothetical protein